LNAARLTGEEEEEEEEEDLDEKHGRRVFCWVERKINRNDITRVFYVELWCFEVWEQQCEAMHDYHFSSFMKTSVSHNSAVTN
jgi:hypothetical protein